MKDKDNIDNNRNEKENKEIKNNIEENEPNEKKSIIPEDNDIFGTRNYDISSKNNLRPRKIQEDGIPVIKRVEEKDNVKDIMINNYAANDDDYYNMPPIGKPKARRIKRLANTNENSHNKKINENKNKDDSKIKNTIENEKKDNDNYREIKQTTLVKEEEKTPNNKNIYQKVTNKEIQRGFKGNITTSLGVFPSQLKSISNEAEILNLETQLYNLQKQRDIINDEYLKFPEYPKKREEINEKRKIEIKLEEMNKQISLQKLKIRELKEQK